MDMQWLEAALSQAVRTPLHSFLGFLELFSMTDVDDEQRRLIDHLVASSEDLLGGTDRILWLVRLQEGRYRPHQRTVDLPSFVAELVAASDGSLSSVVAPDAPRQVQTDLGALHQLVAELVSNATVHGAHPVVLAVSPAEPGSAAVRITVSDGGAGMPSAARRLLQGAVAGSAPAAGLGLLLVRQLAALLGGTVQMLPTHIGTSVTLLLPVAAALPAAEAIPAAEDLQASEIDVPARPLRVLLVEDNATNRLLAQRQLTRLGHTLVAVTTGDDGVRAALADEPDARIDVVLMDRHLPDIDGCEATTRIRAALRPDRPHLPIIAVTADATAESRDACSAAGMDEVLTKPVDLHSLEAALSRAAAAIAGAGYGVGAGSGAGAAGARVPAALRALLLRADGDCDAAAELISTYLGELPGRRLRIQASLRRGHARSVLAAAESLRTSSDSVGATAVSGACAALAAAAAGEDLAAARSFVPSLMLQCERFAAELSGFGDAGSIRAAMAPV